MNSDLGSSSLNPLIEELWVMFERCFGVGSIYNSGGQLTFHDKLLFIRPGKPEAPGPLVACKRFATANNHESSFRALVAVDVWISFFQILDVVL